MSNLSRIQSAALDRQDTRLSGTDVATLDGELHALLIRIRVDLDVRAAVIGVAGTIVDEGFRTDRCYDEASRLRICAAQPLALRIGEPLGVLVLADIGARRLSKDETERLARFAETAAILLVQRRDACALARLRVQADAQARLIAEQAATLAHSRKVFERASAAARIGVWECSLPDETLTWTDGVYDIFDMPRGTPPDRRRTLQCYPEASRSLLEQVRNRAIAERSGFSLDTEIVTAKGRHRWIRLTATVECEDGIPVRIFGMKQDITEEKTLADRTRYLAEFDVMTGLANRTQFQSRLETLAGSQEGALLLIDLDGFKQINDTHGHAAGDECLRETALRLQGICTGAETIARIGGDEFAVLLGPDTAVGTAEALATRIVDALGQPVKRGERLFHFGASVGIAWAGACAASELFVRADAALYAAKASGRKTFRIFRATDEPARHRDTVVVGDVTETSRRREPAVRPPGQG